MEPSVETSRGQKRGRPRQAERLRQLAGAGSEWETEAQHAFAAAFFVRVSHSRQQQMAYCKIDFVGL